MTPKIPQIPQTKTNWSSWDDSQLTNLQSVVSAVSQARFHLETLLGSWQKLDDDEVEPIVEKLREAHQELGEIFEFLEEQQSEEYDR